MVRSPSDGGSIIVSMRASVDFPQPDSPTMASVLPPSTTKLASGRRAFSAERLLEEAAADLIVLR